MENKALTFEKVVEQTKNIDDLLRRSFRLNRDGDRVPYVIQGRARFQVGATQTTEMVFNVPSDADFEGEFMNLYLGARVVSFNQAQSPSENAFRPADWFYSSSPFFIAGKAGVLFELRDSVNGPYQNVAIAIPSAFSGAVSAPLFGVGIPQYPGALAFHVPYQLKRGSTLTCRVTPVQTTTIESIDQLVTSSDEKPPPPTLNPVPLQSFETVEFEVRGLFSGYKRTYGLK